LRGDSGEGLWRSDRPVPGGQDFPPARHLPQSAGLVLGRPMELAVAEMRPIAYPGHQRRQGVIGKTRLLRPLTSAVSCIVNANPRKTMPGWIAAAPGRPGREGMRKYRSFAEGSANESNRPKGDLQTWPQERAESTRKRSSAERVGCARSGPCDMDQCRRGYVKTLKRRAPNFQGLCPRRARKITICAAIWILSLSFHSAWTHAGRSASCKIQEFPAHAGFVMP
jgi:hypothetical protein